MRWYVEPLAQQQRSFNDAALKLIDALGELDRAQRRAGERERLVRELEERVLGLERRQGSAPATVAAQPRADALPDYFAFESRMRGPTDVVRERQRIYVDDLRDAAPVLDVGCGRGELLALLRDARRRSSRSRRGRRHGRVRARRTARRRAGRPARHARARGRRRPRRHLRGAGRRAPAAGRARPPPRARPREASAGGVLVLETINPLSPLALRNYFADLTHAQPLVPETLALLVRNAGFNTLETRYLTEPDAPTGSTRASPRSSSRRSTTRSSRGDEDLVTHPQVPFAHGGAEVLAERLTEELNARGHEAALVTVPFKWYPPRGC